MLVVPAVLALLLLLPFCRPNGIVSSGLRGGSCGSGATLCGAAPSGAWMLTLAPSLLKPTPSVGRLGLVLNRLESELPLDPRLLLLLPPAVVVLPDPPGLVSVPDDDDPVPLLLGLDGALVELLLSSLLLVE